MKVIVRTGASGVINLPESLMKALGLQDGDLIHVTVGAGALRLTRLGRFLELRGVLGDDEEFDRAMEFIQEAWKQWDSSMIWAGKPNRGRRCTDAPNHD